MDPKKRSVNIPTNGIIFFLIILLVIGFYAGYSFSRAKNPTAQTTSINTQNSVTFAAVKTDKPELKFFVMSFCPYGNQMEDTLRPVFDLLKNKVAITPHYIFDKIDNLQTYCQARTPDPAKCSTYITDSNAPFKTVPDCKKYISNLQIQCLDEKQYLKTNNNTMYASLHGRQEANEDVREMCAWNQVGDDKTKWWDFIGNINKNCTAQNADTCWQQQAQQAGLDTNQITDCFNKDAVSLIENEIAMTTKYNVQGSPTVLINDVVFPPDNAFTQDNKGSLTIGSKTATQDQYRTPNVIKTALCASFKNAPGECKTELKDLAGAAPPAGGCGN
jgi:hypothetical protein